jgi:hypothetical protein
MAGQLMKMPTQTLVPCTLCPVPCALYLVPYPSPRFCTHKTISFHIKSIRQQRIHTCIIHPDAW